VCVVCGVCVWCGVCGVWCGVCVVFCVWCVVWCVCGVVCGVVCVVCVWCGVCGVCVVWCVWWVVCVCVCVCVCSLSYPARNAHAPYCYLWPAPLYNIFPQYLTNDTIFGRKKLLNTKCVFWFSLQLLSQTFLPLQRILPNTTLYVGLHVKCPNVILIRF
jgi:hypothetical protein